MTMTGELETIQMCPLSTQHYSTISSMCCVEVSLKEREKLAPTI